MAPRVLGLAATQINFYFVAIFFASTLEDGAISAVNFAWLIVMTPLGVIGMAISTAAFPTMAEQAAAREQDQLRDTLSRTLRLILYLSLPISAGLVLLAKPLITVLLQRGEFGVASTDLTSQALMFYALGLFAHSGIEIVSRGFYALGDTRTPVGVSVGAMLLNVALAAVLVGPLEVRGLALALSLATICEFLALSATLSRRMSQRVSSLLGTATAKMAVATGLTACVVAGSRSVLEHALSLSASEGAGALVLLIVAGGAGAVCYFVSSSALGSEEGRMLLGRLPFIGSRLTAGP